MDKALSLLSDKPIPSNERLIFALDLPGQEAAKEMVQRLGNAVQFYKLGLQLFMAGGYFPLIEWLQDRGKKIFVDLKFFDVPETVKLAVQQLERRDVEYATVHGNDGMIRAAVEVKKELKILAVTALTSLDEGDLRDLGFACDPAALVYSRARRALEAGCDGVVSSGLEVERLREGLGQRLIIVVPGIRPVQNKPVDDQKRTVDLREAFLAGADHVVVGRPIRDAKDPAAAAAQLQSQIEEIFRGAERRAV